jgi:hypothetical protein
MIEYYGFRSIDYLKMDIEGAEYEVVEHMSTKTASIIKQMSMELHSDDASVNALLCSNLDKLGFNVLVEKAEVYAWPK